MNATEAAEELAGRCESLCGSLFPDGRRERNEFLIGNINGDVGRSLAIHLSGDKAGVWKDFNSGDSGDLVGLIKATNHMDTYEAIEWAMDWLGIDDDDDADSTRAATPP